jgi:hypothetical protein
MFTLDEEKYLIRLLNLNDVVLFLGSGYSALSKNNLGENLPTGWVFAQKLWDFLGYKGDSSTTSLQELYEAFLLNKKIKKGEKLRFLEENLLAKNIPVIYDNLCNAFWYKIYTTNVDNVITDTYRRNHQRLDKLKYPNDKFKERDQSLETTQLVHLHGELPCLPEDLIFSTSQYAASSTIHNPLYWHFVQEYSTKPTIFVGTSLNEPLFEQYIQARQQYSKFSERRPQSFLITKSISEPKKDILKGQYNVDFIEGSTEDFLNWLQKIKGELKSKEDVLWQVNPNLGNLKLKISTSKVTVRHSELNEFSISFKPVQTELQKSDGKSKFLLGASPMWNDIIMGLDAQRKVTSAILDFANDKFNNSKKVEIVAVIGSGGSGKSTLLKRIGYQMRLDGRSTYLNYSEFLPKSDMISRVLTAFGEKTVLLFDNAGNIINQLPELVKELNKMDKPPLIILSIRANAIERLATKLEPILQLKEFEIPNLDRDEIQEILNILEKNNLLDQLRGKTNEDRIKVFEQKAKKQILVAMKEATKGEDFNKIIAEEFASIETSDASLICLCIALYTELGFLTTKQEIIGFSDLTPADTLYQLDRNLKGITINVGLKYDKYMIRHRVIAEHYVKNCASLEQLKKAYINVLSVIAPEIQRSHTPSRRFSLYKELINHAKLYRRFKEDINLARHIYDSVSELFKTDYHFWLQYGSLEAEGVGGDLDLAENYIGQAESLMRVENYYILNAKGNLMYKRAIKAKVDDVASDYREKAKEILINLIQKRGADDPYSYFIYLAGEYNYITTRIRDRALKKSRLDSLLKIAKQGFHDHPRNQRIKHIADVINKAYLYQTLDEEINDPVIMSNYEDLS